MSNLQEIIKYSENNSVVKRVRELLDKDSAVFITSVVNLSRGSDALQKCTPDSVWGSAMKAAALKLPIEPSLGYAYVIPYGKEATFQLGYKGLIQLAIRSGQYRKIHATGVYQDEIEVYNPITGELKVKNNPEEFKMRYDGKSQPVGYYARLELHSGFIAEVYMTKRDVEAHGKRFSQTFANANSPWKKDFDAMGEKTVLKQLLGRYGILSIEMQRAFLAEEEIPNFEPENNAGNTDGIADAETKTRKPKKEKGVIDAEVTEKKDDPVTAKDLEMTREREGRQPEEEKKEEENDLPWS